MGQFDIFIASSSEQKAFASRIADALSRLQHRPIRWWTSFDATSYTLESLESALQQADAGVFVCIGDDRASVRENAHTIPRDNVILELGLFLGVVGRRRCFIVADGDDRRLRLPTDLAGITMIPAGTDPDSIASIVLNGIQSALDNEHKQWHVEKTCIHVRADADIASKVNATPTPVAWHQRALYCGTEGAKAWLAYSDDELNRVKDSDDPHTDEEQTIAALEDGEWRSFVSLGPGDARRDAYIYAKLKTTNPHVQYVPVDISEGLIHHAATQLASVGAQVPFGLLGDFEDGQAFLFEHLNGSLPRPRLIALLGNTLGNLDVGAEKFLRQIGANMRSGDQLLLDVTTTNKTWEFDPYRTYFKSKVRRQFIAQGMARQLGQHAHEILDQFQDRILAKRTKAPEYTEQYVIYDKQTDKLALTIRAHYFDKFRSWITKTLPFDEKYANEYSFEKTTFGAGLIRLSKR